MEEDKMKVGLILKDKEKSGFICMKTECLSRLLMKTSKSDLQDIAMLISHPDTPKVFSEAGSFFFL